MSEGRTLRERFKNDYVQLLKDTFGETIFQIQQLPSVVDASLYQQCLETITNQGTEDDRAALLLMGGYWDVKE